MGRRPINQAMIAHHCAVDRARSAARRSRIGHYAWVSNLSGTPIRSSARVGIAALAVVGVATSCAVIALIFFCAYAIVGLLSDPSIEIVGSVLLLVGLAASPFFIGRAVYRNAAESHEFIWAALKAAASSLLVSVAGLLFVLVLFASVG
jgi:hypothetical protein